MSEELAWAAGFIDGEGCISITNQGQQMAWGKKYTLRPAVTVTNTNESSLYRVRSIVGGVGRIYEVKRQSERHKRTWKLHIRGEQEVRTTLEAIGPYLFVKRQLAIWLLAFMRLSKFRNGGKYGRITEFERNIYACIKWANRRGKDQTQTTA